MPVGGEKVTPGNPIASMVDIAFLLLIFFLVAMTIAPTERDLPLRLPVPNGAPAPLANHPGIVSIERDGSVVWGEEGGRIPVAAGGEDLGRLDEMLKLSVAAWGLDQPGMMLRVDDEAAQQRFIDVLDAFTRSGVETVGMIE